jgi:hypothetical protein
MQSLLPKDDEPIKPIQPPQQQPPQPQGAAPQQAGPPPGYQYPPQGFVPPNYPPPSYQQAPNYQQPNYPPPSYQQPAPQQYGPAPSGGNLKTNILMGAVIALVGACGFLFYQVNEVKTQVSDTKESLLTEIEKIHEASSVTVQTSKTRLEAMQKQVQEARAQAAALSGEAKKEAEKHADELAARLEKAQTEQGQKVAAISTEVAGVKDVANATSAKVGEVSTDVGSLKTETATNRSQIEKTIADLKSARGDLGMQSGLIATNSKELLALKQLGERNYIEFKIAKAKKNVPQKVGDIQVILENADPKKNKFSIVVIADDKKVEKKDRTVNEPIQFLLSKAVQPYELVVNDVKKDLIVGYLSTPKVQQTRN